MGADVSATASGITRRTMIRRAAAAGAIAWSAPVIVDSLASPAAAGTLNGCYRAEFALSGNSYVRTTPSEGSGCVPNFWNGLPEYP
jgi:hypothetical protein